LKKKNTPGAMNSGQVWCRSDEMARPGLNGGVFLFEERKRRVAARSDSSHLKHKKTPDDDTY
jgi:hypothetical protein